MRTLRIALAQINPTVGDIRGNTGKIIGYTKKARSMGADIIVFPELAVTGYPPEDLLFKPHFIDENLRAVEKIAKETRGIASILGFVDRTDDIYNAAAVVSEGKIAGVYHKTHLPNYGVFDEYRYFQCGKNNMLFRIAGALVGINICEDIWIPDGPHRHQALSGAEVLININASPYSIGKLKRRRSMLATRAADSAAIVAYLNAAGGQDELVFDGRSMVFNERGEMLAEAGAFKEDLLTLDLDIDAVSMRRLSFTRRREQVRELGHRKLETIEIPLKKSKASPQHIQAEMPAVHPPKLEEEVYGALRLGVTDYVRKNGFKGVLIGLSGGVDSALVATIAVDALGRDAVKGIFMPSKFTSRHSRDDAYGLAGNLGIKMTEIAINDIFDSYIKELKDEFRGLKPDAAEENIQARIRGNLLMALSNKFGLLVLTTGNKSEMSVGYATLYGDMAGGFAVVKDVPKTLVYRLSIWRNGIDKNALIPRRIIAKAPTAELRPNQKDTDSLPPYETLDPILQAYVEDEKNPDEIIAMGFKPADVKRVLRMVERSEYKRRQSPPGIKITRRAFGRDRRFPITNGYITR